MKSNYTTVQPKEIADWHPADVVAALRKAGLPSLRELSENNGYHPASLRNTLVRQWQSGERIISKALGVHPAVIWPSRYDSDGKPKHKGRGRPKNRLHEVSISTENADA